MAVQWPCSQVPLRDTGNLVVIKSIENIHLKKYKTFWTAGTSKLDEHQGNYPQIKQEIYNESAKKNKNKANLKTVWSVKVFNINRWMGANLERQVLENFPEMNRNW